MGYGMNKLIFDKLYFFTLNNEKVKRLAIFVSKISKPAFIFIYIMGIISVMYRGGEEIVRIIAVPLLTLVFNTVLRKTLNIPRPFNREDITNFVEHKNSGSFPSNHACSSMIISLSYSLIYPQLVPAFMALAFFTGLSRIMTGVHYPSDVLCGWLISLVFGIILFVIL